MEFGRKITICLFMMIIMWCYAIEGREPVLHRVGGGRYTWRPNVSFTNWTSYEHFYQDDWLYFGFDRNVHNVLEVNKTNYENCIETDFIKNVTRGGRDVVQLLEMRSYYYICGRGFCNNGMKVEINIEPDLPLSPTIFSQASSTAKMNVLFSVIGLAWIFI
ncbi:early nodulin-like protein 20 [Vicia villosa]|uniref:early nodulin-like protein 20 n=1 Tax=Vicia villosa TaxID=3911 RepID=UPI00273BCF3A|nr:early nodulin-like protein 20 [Vicia villosa]XP_058782990.1 early nodulin-like protein 20 [Vicia villosa]